MDKTYTLNRERESGKDEKGKGRERGGAQEGACDVVATTHTHTQHTHTHSLSCTHTDVAWNPGSSLACSWDTRIHMRHDRMRVCVRECMPVACVRALVRGCVCVSVCVGGGTGRTIHTDADARRHAP